ncbi:MAG TPA: hypothetical protein VIN10_03330 [Bacteroidales bacterium]
MAKRILLTAVVFMLILTAFSQEKILKGKVVISTCNDALPGVNIYCCDSMVAAASKAFGRFTIAVPDSAESLVFSKSKFNNYIFEIPQKSGTEKVIVSLIPVNENKFPALKKNTIAFAPFELVNKKITLMYERFVTRRHSVGIYNDIYINSHTILYKTPIYNGYKMELFYRYYPFRNKYFGTYIQGKVMWGYFNADDIPYYRVDYHGYESEITVSNQFYTGGLGLSGGISLYFAGNLYFSASIGYQYFPMNVPNTVEYENKDYRLGTNSGSFLLFNSYTNPWYFTGPGSITEIKFLFGGIF